jgi:MerR family transcriptional regulator, mercuric resistance operon regulatory protein
MVIGYGLYQLRVQQQAMARNITKSLGQVVTIGELATLSGVHLETIRYFERIGLLLPPERSRGGHRLFSASHLARLSFIRRAREMGFSQDEVRALLSLSDGELASCGEVKKLAENHLARIRHKIRDLKRLERLLASTVAQCTGGKAPKCPVIEAIASD